MTFKPAPRQRSALIHRWPLRDSLAMRRMIRESYGYQFRKLERQLERARRQQAGILAAFEYTAQYN